MPITTINVTCKVKDLLDAIVDMAALEAKLHVRSPRSFIHGTTLIGPFEKSADFDDQGDVSLEVVETETPGVKLEFFITMNEGKSKRSIYFEPVIVPSADDPVSLLSLTNVREEIV